MKSAAKNHMRRWSSRGSFGKSRNESVIVDSTVPDMSAGKLQITSLKMYQDD
jgi:hypothetical protein